MSVEYIAAPFRGSDSVRANVGGSEPHGLEQLCCRHGGHRLRFGCGVAGIERLEAELTGVAFAPHRHDTYAIGTTCRGVQTFRYRGELRHCLPGEWHVLHPDELHDGAPGTDEGFAYRIVYLDPALIQDAVGGLPLPFVADPVIHARGVAPTLAGCLGDIDDPLEEIEAVDLAAAIADMLSAHAGVRRPRRPRLDLDAMRRVRAFLMDDVTTRRPVEDFERVADLDPVDDRPAVPGSLRHQPHPLPDHASARPGTPADERGSRTQRGRDGRGLRGPEPPDTDVQAHLRAAAGRLDSGRPRAGAVS